MSYLQRMNNPRRCKPGGQPALTMEFSPRPTGCLCRSSCANCRHSGHLRMLDGRDVDNVREVCCSNYLREFNGSVSKVTGINTGHHLEERNWSWPWRCSNFHFFWGELKRIGSVGPSPWTGADMSAWKGGGPESDDFIWFSDPRIEGWQMPRRYVFLSIFWICPENLLGGSD